MLVSKLFQGVYFRERKCEVSGNVSGFLPDPLPVTYFLHLSKPGHQWTIFFLEVQGLPESFHPSFFGGRVYMGITPNNPKWSFLGGKPMVVGYHPPYLWWVLRGYRNFSQVLPTKIVQVDYLFLECVLFVRQDGIVFCKGVFRQQFLGNIRL